MATALKGFATRWERAVSMDEAQAIDNDFAWEVMFVYAGPHAAMRTIRFAGMTGVDPGWLRRVLTDKQERGMRAVETAGESSGDRCALCWLPFGSLYDDPVRGPGVRIERNRRNRYYCNMCDAFIRLCPGQVTLMLPVLMVDVKGSKTIRREVGLRAYSQLLASFQRRVAGLIQKNMGFVLNTIGDAVIGVWPSGFVPQSTRDALGWDPDQPASIPAIQATRAAADIAGAAPASFDGRQLPFRGALDTSDTILFAVTAGDADATSMFEAGPADAHEVGDPVMSAEGSDIGTGPAATDIAGQAVEIVAELAGHDDLPSGNVWITQRTDEIARCSGSGFRYRPVGVMGTPVRVIGSRPEPHHA